MAQGTQLIDSLPLLFLLWFLFRFLLVLRMTQLENHMLRLTTTSEGGLWERRDLFAIFSPFILRHAKSLPRNHSSHTPFLLGTIFQLNFSMNELRLDRREKSGSATDKQDRFDSTGGCLYWY